MPFGNLRLRNLFSPYQIPGPSPYDVPNMQMDNSIQEPQYVPQLPPFQVQPTVPQQVPDEDWTARFQQLYQPEETNINRMNQMLTEMPQRQEPSKLRKIGATIAGLGINQNVIDRIAYAPYYRQMGDWETQFKPAYQAANLERQENINRRQLAQNVALREAGTAKETRLAGEKQQDLAIKQQRADAIDWAHKNPHLELIKQPGGNLMARNPITNQTAPVLDGQGNPIPSNIMTDKQIIDLKFQGDIQKLDVQGAQRQQLQGIRGTQAMQQIGAHTAGQKEVEEIRQSGRKELIQERAVAPPKLTNQTQTQMEGAKTLIPLVANLDKQALDLEKRGLFGPLMSRLRDLSAKHLGTVDFNTAPSGEVQKSFEQLGNAIQNDSQLMSQFSNDVAVGKFLTDLGFLSSGMGRIHGGARGGGSIQMIQYMKSIIGSPGLGMFRGQLQSVGGILDKYAAGPQGPSTTMPKTKLDEALNKIFGVK